MAKNELQAGDKVKYHTGDENWKNGVIHGVRKVDDVDGAPRVFTYLVDTGKHARLDVHKYNLKNIAFDEEYNKLRRRGDNDLTATRKAEEAVVKLPDEFVEEVSRQPEQIDVRPECIKPR